MSSIQAPPAADSASSTTSSSYLIPTPQISTVPTDFPLRDPRPYAKVNNNANNNYHYTIPTISHSSDNNYKPPLFINSKARSTSPSDNKSYNNNNNRYNRSRSPISSQRNRRKNSNGGEEKESDISDFHLLPEVVSYYRDLVKSGKLPANTLDGRCFAALKDLGSTKAIDALRAISECNINKIRNPVPYFLQIVKRCKNGYLLLDGYKKRL